jgi:hypothetical protein
MVVSYYLLQIKAVYLIGSYWFTLKMIRADAGVDAAADANGITVPMA